MVIAAHFEGFAGGADIARDSRRVLQLEAQGRTSAGEAAQVLVHNISVSGLLLESEVPLEREERIDIDLPHAGKTCARVIWTSGRFFGCQFDAPISPAALSAAELRSEFPAAPVKAAPPAPLAGESFGARLHGLRKQRGLTMAQLAEQLGVSKPTVWAWEQGKARPVAERTEALAQALDVPAADLLLGRSTPLLPDLIARAKAEIANALGVTPDKIRIAVDL